MCWQFFGRHTRQRVHTSHHPTIHRVPRPPRTHTHTHTRGTHAHTPPAINDGFAGNDNNSPIRAGARHRHIRRRHGNEPRNDGKHECCPCACAAPHDACTRPPARHHRRQHQHRPPQHDRTTTTSYESDGCAAGGDMMDADSVGMGVTRTTAAAAPLDTPTTTTVTSRAP